VESLEKDNAMLKKEMAVLKCLKTSPIRIEKRSTSRHLNDTSRLMFGSAKSVSRNRDMDVSKVISHKLVDQSMPAKSPGQLEGRGISYKSQLSFRSINHNRKSKKAFKYDENTNRARPTGRYEVFKTARESQIF